MNLVHLSLADLRSRALNTTLNLTLLALGIAMIVVILLVTTQVEERLRRDAAGIDLVVGAKGSSTQLVLSAVYELDAPTAPIANSDVQRISMDLAVRSAMPVALADNYYGYRIVGTTQQYLNHYGAVLAVGRLWQSKFEAVLGADVAARMRVGAGVTFTAAHGLRGGRDAVHEKPLYQIVGVLARTGTVLDRLVFTDVASVAEAHTPEFHPDPAGLVQEPPEDDRRTVTALLLQCISTEAAAELAGRINAETNLQAAVPAVEIGRLFGFIGIGREVLWGFAILLMLTAGVSAFIALYDALTEHRHELAIMRVLGAGPRRLMALLLLEGLALAAAGAVAGLVLGHLFTSALGVALNRAGHLSVTGWTWHASELWIVALALAVGLAAAFLPAWRARGIDIAETLARG